MIYFLLDLILWTLALYGLFEIIKTIIYAYTYSINKPEGIYIIIATKNQEKTIEGFLRSTLFNIMYHEEERVKKIIIADLASKDKTKEIAEKVSKENDAIKVVDWKTCKDMMEQINIDD